MDRSIHFDAAWAPDSPDDHERLVITAAIASYSAHRLSCAFEPEWLVTTCAMSDGTLYIAHHRPSRWTAAEPSAHLLAHRIRGRRHMKHWRRAS